MSWNKKLKRWTPIPFSFFIGFIVGCILCFVLQSPYIRDIASLFKNTSGKIDMSIVWTSVGAISTILFTGIIGLVALWQNHKIKIDKDKQLLLDSGFLMVHDYPKLQDNKITISLRNVKGIAIASCENISVNINEQKFDFTIGGGYLTNGTLDYSAMFPIECITQFYFKNAEQYDFDILLLLKAENNLISKMHIYLKTIFVQNTFEVQSRDFSKELVKL